MTAAPWRCSQCGTINEPVANSCRTCGRWPSLFELEDSELRGEEETPAAPASLAEREPFFEVGELAPAEPAPGEEPEQGRRPRRSLATYLIPLAFVVYIVLSFFFGER